MPRASVCSTPNERSTSKKFTRTSWTEHTVRPSGGQSIKTAKLCSVPFNSTWKGRSPSRTMSSSCATSKGTWSFHFWPKGSEAWPTLAPHSERHAAWWIGPFLG